MNSNIIDGKYEILGNLGRGGFGIVYKVRNLATGENFALKICTENDEENVRRFKREVRLMKDIEDINVIKIIDENLENEPPYFVMPLANGSLKGIMHTLKDNHDLALDLFLQVCTGIKALHNSNKIHRDIKPENILLFDENKVVVSDLGLGKFENRDSTILTSSSIYMGTEGYIPPEFMARGGTKSADARGDVFQLGKTLYFILTGEYPSLIENNILPPGLTYIIQKAIKNNPNDRYKTVGELMDAIYSYKLSLDQNSNPFEKFENHLKTSIELLKEGKFEKNVVEEMLQIVYETKEDAKTFFDYFDKIPDKIIEVCSNQLAEDFEPIFEEYTNQIKDFFYNGRLGFSYAETVASKMKRIYINAKRLDFKVMALRNILFSSVYFNRFAAIEIFDQILTSIKDNDEAMAIAGMLREDIDFFESRVEHLPKRNLHVAIQDVCNLVNQRIKERETDKNNKDQVDEW